ncbi:MAG: GNAT family N-acetyltransferase [Firmicutes bacterium]|nr:GNAT family N-acetyltransferase [Bacillota bacterium]
MYKIEKASRSELPALIELGLKTERELNSFIDEKYWKKFYTKERMQFFNSTGYIAKSGGEIYGFISLSDSGTIYGLFVHPEHTNRGVGRALIEEALKHTDELECKIYMKNRAALRFATAMRFMIVDAQLDTDTEQIQYIVKYSKHTNDFDDVKIRR